MAHLPSVTSSRKVGRVARCSPDGVRDQYRVCPQTLRVQSAEGTARVEVLESDVTARLFERVHEVLCLTSFAFALHKDRARKDEVLSSKTRTLRDYGLQHGDMLFLSPVNGALLFEQPSTSTEVLSNINDSIMPTVVPFKE